MPSAIPDTRKTWPARVVTRDLENPETVTEKVIDYRLPKARSWYSKHVYWAMNNNHSVTIHPLSK